jgi:NADH:ubiquinone oxidoreductase subunit|tara:strand:- start:4595 stop:4939 length:345 start_codon:yes stop_codon:yes gene_type:complete
MNLINKFLIRLFNNKVGSDDFGNEYFLSKDKKKRYIVYNGIVEATKIPSEWHIWIHYKTNKIPSSYQNKKFFWQKSHLPNLTGTQNAYYPKPYSSNQGCNSTNTYSSWNPSKLD